MKQSSNLPIETAVANLGGAMEAETILTNGAKPKSHTSRVNFKIFAFVILVVTGIIAIKSCKKDDEKNVPQNVIDLVNEPDVFPEKETFERREVIVPGTRDIRTEQTNTQPDGIRRSSLEDCIYNVKWTCDTILVSASQNPDDFAMFNPLASVLWPGNLVQGKSLASGVPTSIPVTKRRPGTVSLAIVSSDAGGATNKMYREIGKMQFSSVNQAMNEILSGFGGHGYAQYSFEMDFIESSSDLSFKANASFKGGPVSASAAFGANFSDKRQRMLVKLHQSYFTMVYDDPAGLDGVFTPDITFNDLRNYTGDGNPICYISSVTYGRYFYLLYESEATKDELEAALTFSYTGVFAKTKAEAELEFVSTMQKTRARVVQLGGNAEGAITAAMALDLKAIQTFLENGINFSDKNPGAPISYTVKYLKNAQLVRMNNALEYEVEQCVSETLGKECPELPQLTTNAVTTYTNTTATLGGNITNEGTPAYFERGVVINTTPTSNPTIANKREIIGTGMGIFSESISGLTPGTTYYVRAYASNRDDTAFGNEVSFTTEEEPAIFNLSTGIWSKGTTASNKCTWNGTVLGVGNGANMIVTGSVSNGRRIDVAADANVNITLKNVSITGVSSDHCPLAIYNNATVNLTIEENNTLTAGNDWAGIRVPSGSTLTIDGTGSLTVTGGSGCAGIGGNRGGIGSNGGAGRNGDSGGTGESGGTITINSGTIVAIGGADAAGIGGGRGGNGGIGGKGDVFACPGHGGKGGNGGAGGTITINGGTVSAEGSDAIGGGRGGSGGSKGEYVGFCLVDIFNGSGGEAGNEGSITIFGNKTLTDLGGGRNKIVVSDQ